MTVPATTRRAGPFTGNGVTTSFPFTFKTFDTEDLAVTLTDVDALESTLVLDSDYSVTLNGDQDASPGGAITYPLSGAPLAAAEKLTVIGAVDYDQQADLPTGGSFSPVVIENALDRATFQIQQLVEQAGRALTVAPAYGAIDNMLPAPESSKAIGWNEAGTALVNYSPSDFATVVVNGTSYTDVFSGTGAQVDFALTANPGSVNALDIAISGVSQVNGVDFTVSGSTLTFTSAPPAATGNICVRYVAALPVGVANAQDIVYDPDGGSTMTVQAKLRETVSVLDFGAVGDGTTNDTAAFTLALNSGASRVLVPGGRTYIVKDATDTASADVLVLPAGVTLEGDGPGAVIKLGAHSTQGHRLVKVTGANSSVLNITLDGNKAQQTGAADEQSHLLFILGGSNTRAHSVMFKDARGDGVYIGGTTEPGATNIEVSGSFFDGNVRQGVSIVRGSVIRIIGNDIYNTTGNAPGAGIDLEANNAADTLKQIVIANNTIRDNYWGVFVHELAPAREVTITGNTFSANRSADIFCRGTQITIADNIISVGAKDVTYAAIDLTDCAQVSVTGNSIIGSYDAEERGGIRISRGVRSAAIVGNTIKNTLGSGISIYPGNAVGTGESRGITVIGNVLENCLPDSSTSGAMVIGAAAAGAADLLDVVVRNNIIRDTRTGGLQAALGIRIINQTAAMLQTWDIGNNAVSGTTAQITSISTWAAVNGLLTAKATLNFDLTAVASQDLTISVPGAVAGAPVHLGAPNGAVTAATFYFAWVSATDTVTVRAMRLSGTPDPASGTFTVTVAKMLA